MHFSHANYIPLHNKINIREDVHWGNQSEQGNLNGIMSRLYIFWKMYSYPPHNCHHNRGDLWASNSLHRISNLKILITKNKRYWEVQHYFCSKIHFPPPLLIKQHVVFSNDSSWGRSLLFQSQWIFCILGINDITLIKYAPKNQNRQILVKKINHSYYFGD
jgi:hypothetical protein